MEQVCWAGGRTHHKGLEVVYCLCPDLLLNLMCTLSVLSDLESHTGLSPEWCSRPLHLSHTARPPCEQ